MPNRDKAIRPAGSPQSRDRALGLADVGDLRASLIAALQARDLTVLECRGLREFDLGFVQRLLAAPADGSLRDALLRGGFLSVCGEGDECEYGR